MSNRQRPEKAFDFAAYAPTRFKKADLTTRANILRTLGESLILENGKLLMETPEWLVPLAEHYPEIQKQYLYIRTKHKTAPKEVMEAALERIFESWRAIWDSNPGHAA
jgi:hypothetical protein